jgi:hypothetical protein
MIPASPAIIAPPVKKQRAGNTPDDPIAARTESALNYRSERLHDLAQRYGTATRSQHQLPQQNGIPPPIMKSSIAPPNYRQPGASVRGGGIPPPSASNGKLDASSIARGPPYGNFGTRSNKEVSSVAEMQQERLAQQQRPPPPKPGTAAMQPRHSDIFPNVAKQTTKNSTDQLSPILSKPSSSSFTMTAIKSPPISSLRGDEAIARRLEHSFHANSPDRSRSKSAPPSRPPPPPGPPPGPPPFAKDEPAKSVSFRIQNTGSVNSPVTQRDQARPTPMPSLGKSPESTTTPDDTAMSTRDAGVTPFYSAAPPGTTPFRSHVIAESPKPVSTARRDLLRNMREFAETPQKPLTSPSGSIENSKSPELRLHEQLAISEKEKAAALRMVAELQVEISQRKSSESLSQNNKHVGFLSPVANVLASPVQNRGRRVGTPHPKSNLPKPTTPTEIDAERHWFLEATKRTPFQYDAEDGTTLIVRRPHGLATELDLWYKAGQLPAKLYANTANVEYPSTIEVVAVIDADHSIFILFGEGEVRHQSTVSGTSAEYSNVNERSVLLGNVSYVDKHAIDQEYSLDDLYDYASWVRGHYCTTVRSFAAALQLHPEPLSASPAVTVTGTTVSVSEAVESAEKSIAHDEVVIDKSKTEEGIGNLKTEEITSSKKPKPSLPPPPEDDSTSDVLASFIQLFFSTIFGTIWFIFFKLPIRILTSTLVIAASAVLLSYIWLYLIDDNGGSELGATIRMHSNRPGIL